MITRSGHYYGAPFKVSRGVTQFNPLFTTIFNILMYVVILHWVMVVASEKVVP